MYKWQATKKEKEKTGKNRSKNETRYRSNNEDNGWESLAKQQNKKRSQGM